MQVAPCPGILPFIKGVNELCLINETGFVRPGIPIMLSQRHDALNRIGRDELFDTDRLFFNVQYMLATDGLRQLKMPVLFLMKTLHSKMGQPMLVNWFYGGGLRESPFYGSRGTDFVIPLPVSEGIPGVQLVGIKYCGWAMKDM